AIFYRIVHGQPDLTGMPVPLVPLVLAALARDPARRPTAVELAAGVAGLAPADLVPAVNGHDLAAAAALAPRTLHDMSVAQQRDTSAALAGRLVGGAAAGGAAAGAAAAAAPGLGPAASAPVGPAGPVVQANAAAAIQWPATRSFAARPPADYADLLPPVNY